MTIPKYIQCPTCDCCFIIKLQMDVTIKNGWHLSFVCPDCGDMIEMSIDSSLQLPYEIDPKDANNGYVLGYNPLLPNSSINYFFRFEEPHMVMASLSVFMALQVHEVENHMAVVGMIMNNVLNLSNIFSQLLPMLQRNNIPAFSKKLATLLGHKKYEEIDNPIDAYEDLIFATYRNFASKPYSDVVSPIMSAYQRGLKLANHTDILSIKNKMNNLGIKIGKWKRDKAYLTISHYVEQIDMFFQGMYYFNNGKFEVPHFEPLYTTTISVDNALALYSEAFECYSSILPFMIAVTNFISYGSINDFGSSDSKYNSIDAFCALTAGHQIEVIVKNNHPSNLWLLSALSNDLRNGFSHKSYKYDTVTQTISIYDKDDDSKIIHTELLMDVCHRTHILVLHIMEAIRMGNIFNKIVQ